MNLKTIYKDRPFLVKIIALAIIAFALAILKYVLYSSTINASFLIIDILSLLAFLTILYITDLFYRTSTNKLNNNKLEFENAQSNWNNQRERLKQRIDELEERENRSRNFASYQEKVMQKLFNQKIRDQHHFLHQLSEILEVSAAILYKESNPEGHFNVHQCYAVPEEFNPQPFIINEGINGQAASEGKPIVVKDIPTDYLHVSSGLGDSKKGTLYYLPVIKNNKCIYLIEMVTFKETDIEKIWENISARIVEKGIL
jgi:hypothetical protein